MGKLTWKQVTALSQPGRYGDGNGLYLQVQSKEAKSWFFRYQLGGRRREMGLGAIDDVSLAAAREAADAARRQVAQGVDPIPAREAALAAQRAAEVKSATFKEVAEAFIEGHEYAWKNAKHRQQWRNTLKTYVYPVLGNRPVEAIDTDLVLKVLQPIWHKKPETASRVRGRIERILSAAKVKKLRAGENPAQWRGHLDQLLPPRGKVRRVRHQPAMPYQEVPQFMAWLRTLNSVSSRALQFTILTAVRTTETRLAVRSEIDRETKTWIIPAERMKSSREHRVPLSGPALAILDEMNELRLSKYIFPGAKPKRPLSDMAMLECLQGRHPDLTVHGFRSSFRDWASEKTMFPSEVVEMALAHAIKDKTEAAYRRGDLLDKRRELMSAWADFCLGQSEPKAPT